MRPGPPQLADDVGVNEIHRLTQANPRNASAYSWLDDLDLAMDTQRRRQALSTALDRWRARLALLAPSIDCSEVFGIEEHGDPTFAAADDLGLPMSFLQNSRKLLLGS